MARPCAACGTALNEGEAQCFTVCEACWEKTYRTPLLDLDLLRKFADGTGGDWAGGRQVSEQCKMTYLPTGVDERRRCIRSAGHGGIHRAYNGRWDESTESCAMCGRHDMGCQPGVCESPIPREPGRVRFTASPGMNARRWARAWKSLARRLRRERDDWHAMYEARAPRTSLPKLLADYRLALEQIAARWPDQEVLCPAEEHYPDCPIEIARRALGDEGGEG